MERKEGEGKLRRAAKIDNEQLTKLGQSFEEWFAVNADAIRRYDQWIEEHGMFGDKARLF